MRPQPLILALSAAMAIASIDGCSDTLAPIRSGTKFVLVRIGEEALPTLTGSGAGAQILTADTLFFSTRDAWSGTVEHHQTVQFNSGPVSSSYSELYRLHDGVLTFSLPPCPPNADCTPGFGQPTSETGRFGPGTLTITYDSPLVRPRAYARVY